MSTSCSHTSGWPNWPQTGSSAGWVLGPGGVPGGVAAGGRPQPRAISPLFYTTLPAGQRATEAYEAARERVRRFLNAASATEIVCALGLEHLLVGRSHECDYPASVRELPACTKPRFRTEGSSAEIHREVRDTLSRALSVYSIDTEMLSSLKPDIVITQDQCEVCAVSLSDVENALCNWIESRPRLISLQPDVLDDIFEDILTVAEALGAEDAGASLNASLRGRIDAIARKTMDVETLPRIATVEWIDPYMAAGNWVPELVTLAGGENLFGTAGQHSPRMQFDSVVQADPDVLVVFPCGFDIPRTKRELPARTDTPAWKSLRAVKDGRVFAADGNQYFNRPGPRIVESLEIFAEILHPEAFAFGHEGTGWVRL